MTPLCGALPDPTVPVPAQGAAQCFFPTSMAAAPLLLHLLDLPREMLMEITSRVAGGEAGRRVWASCCKTLRALPSPLYIPYPPLNWTGFASDAETGSLSLVQWLWPVMNKISICGALAEAGHLEALQWAYPRVEALGRGSSVCTRAATGGHLPVLQWLRAQTPPCEWDAYTCAGATVNGNLAVLQWARAQDPPCPWDWFTPITAGAYGYLAVLQWIVANGGGGDTMINSETCAHVASRGHLEIIQWLRARDPPCRWTTWTCINAACCGQLAVLQWAIANGCPLNIDMVRKYARVNVLAWLDEQHMY